MYGLRIYCIDAYAPLLVHCLCYISYLCLAQVEEKLNELKKQYDEKLAQKEELKNKAEMLELKLDRAAKLVSGLAGERVRWEDSVKVSCHVFNLILTQYCIYICIQYNYCMCVPYAVFIHETIHDCII